MKTQARNFIGSLILLFSLILTLCPLAGSQTAKVPGKPAIYRGLLMGKAKREDLVRLFGKPKLIAEPEGQRKTDKPQLWIYHYSLPDRPDDSIMAYVGKQTGIVYDIDWSAESFDQEDVIKLLGRNFIESRYSFCPCDDGEDSAPIYEDAHGDLLYLEYRTRGISVFFTGGTAIISYQSKHYELAKKEACNKVCKKIF